MPNIFTSSCKSHSPAWSQTGQSNGWFRSKASRIFSLAFKIKGVRVHIIELGKISLEHAANNLYGPASVSTKHIRQLEAIDNFSWKQNRGTTRPIKTKAWIQGIDILTEYFKLLIFSDIIAKFENKK